MVADPDADRYFTCPDGAVDTPRVVNPPLLVDVETYVDWLIAVKRDPALVRVGVSGGVNTLMSSAAGRNASACVADSGLASEDCGCWSEDTNSIYCDVTAASGGRPVPYPTDVQPAGCNAMPATRYVEFLDAIESRAAEAGIFGATFSESICEGPLDSFFPYPFVSHPRSRCYELEHSVVDPEQVIVRLNGDELAYNRSGSQRGWYLADHRTVCLTGGAAPGPGDVVEIVYDNVGCSTEE